MYGFKVKGKVSLTEGIHPEVIAVAGFAGQWAKGKPIASARGGAHFDDLFPVGEEGLRRLDFTCGNLDWCAKVSVTKA